MKGKKTTSLIVTGAIALLGGSYLAFADSVIDSSGLRDAVTLENVRLHQEEFQAIADANGGTRFAGEAGHDESAEYVHDLMDAAGYQVSYQEFLYPLFSELSDPFFERVSPDPEVFTPNDLDGFFTQTYSGAGDVTAVIQPTNDIVIPPGNAAGTSNSGCEPEDFSSADFTGKVALIQRGTCDFQVKAENAQAAGAAAVIIFNEGQEGRTEALGGTLADPTTATPILIPVIDTTFAIGEALYEADQSGDVTVHVITDTQIDIVPTHNVIADTPGGRADRTVVVGAHLDSVETGPGINDNGSGSAAILEIALQMAELGIKPVNKVRFAWWSAEESGLIGSQYYVDQLTPRQRRNIALNLNFDMLGSPNYVRFVYDGDGSDSEAAGPNGSKNIEKVFLDYFNVHADGAPLANEPTAFDGRSDYGPFIDVGIPAGGLFSGAEEIKTAQQAAIFGGTAGIALDPCYHQACDTYDNNSDAGLDELTDAAAHAVLNFAMTSSSVNGTAKARRVRSAALADAMIYLGDRLKR